MSRKGLELIDKRMNGQIKIIHKPFFGQTMLPIDTACGLGWLRCHHFF